MSNELKYYKVTRDDGDRYITSEQITQNGDTVQRVYKEPASWSNAGQRGEYLESTFIRPKNWPTDGKRRQYYTPSGKGIDDPWFFESGTQESFDSMWKTYEEYRNKMKNPQSKLPKLNRPDQVESKQPGGDLSPVRTDTSSVMQQNTSDNPGDIGLLEQPAMKGVDVPQAQSATEPQIGAAKSTGQKEPKKTPEAFKQFTGHVKNIFSGDATAESKSASLGAISPHLQAIGGFGKSSLGAVINNKTGNEGKFQEAQAIKEKNKVALNPVMNFNNSAPSFNKGGYFKLFKK